MNLRKRGSLNLTQRGRYKAREMRHGRENKEKCESCLEKARERSGDGRSASYLIAQTREHNVDGRSLGRRKRGAGARKRRLDEPHRNGEKEASDERTHERGGSTNLTRKGNPY
jgi:hypothetical protein